MKSPYSSSSVNRVAEQILDSCTFSCPFPECDKEIIPYKDLENHIKNQCEYRRLFCDLGCFKELKRSEM